jgi:hypothetical protein
MTPFWPEFVIRACYLRRFRIPGAISPLAPETKEPCFQMKSNTLEF